MPYNGTHLLATGITRITQPAPSGSLIPVIDIVKSLANKTVEPTLIQVFAPDPAKPVAAQIIFIDETNFQIPDCYALAAINPPFATVFISTMSMIAEMAGFQTK